MMAPGYMLTGVFVNILDPSENYLVLQKTRIFVTYFSIRNKVSDC